MQGIRTQNNMLFVGTKRTQMEHDDPDKVRLLELLSNISGKERYYVRPMRYHKHVCGRNCGSISICDSCTSRPDAEIRKSIAHSLCSNVPNNRIVTCPTRYACFHMRQRQSWERAAWLKDRLPKLDKLHHSNSTDKAVITHGTFEAVSGVFFKADFCIFSTISFVQKCCKTYQSLGQSSFSDTLKLVHQYC